MTTAAERVFPPVVTRMTELIGGTPLVRLRRLPGPDSADVLVKCEQFNPGGSVKDRVALAMIDRAERLGLEPIFACSIVDIGERP